jgi:hypothetical protein
VNSAASLAAGLPVGRPWVRCLVVAAYAVPAVAVWALAGALLALVPVAAGLVLAVGYGGYYGVTEVTGIPGLAAPGRRWQVPQTMMIDASPWRRVAVWGAILGPGFLTRNPYAGFGLLPAVVVVAGMAGTRAAVALGALVGLAHGGARAIALLCDLGALRVEVVAGAGARAGAGGAAAQLDLLLKAVYARRVDGAVLIAIAAIAAVLMVSYF